MPITFWRVRFCAMAGNFGSTPRWSAYRGDTPKWPGKFKRELAGIISVQDEISRGIVNGLRLKLGRSRRRYETNTEAYDAYLQAIAKAIALDHFFPKRIRHSAPLMRAMGNGGAPNRVSARR